MRFLLLFIIFFSLAWCQNNTSVDTRDQEIVALKAKIEKLTVENANLREENSFIRAGGDPWTVTTTYWTDPTGLSYTEWSYDTCMAEAHNSYISAWSALCAKSGFSTGDILANKCDLSTTEIMELQKIRSQSEADCKNLYQ